VTTHSKPGRLGIAIFAIVAATTSAAVASPLGTWELTVDWPQGPTEVTLDVSEGDAGLVVRWSGVQGTLEGKSVHDSDGELSFALEVTTTTDGSTFETTRLPFRGRIEGDRMEGSLRSPNGGTLRASGSRKP